MEIISGKIVGWERGYITIRAPYDNAERFIRREYEEVEIGLKDGRRITPEQRRKAYALMGEISEWSGTEPEEIKEVLKYEFRKKIVRSLEKDLFSLSSCDVTTAKEFISYLIDFVLRNDVPTHQPLRDLADDIDRYVYACLIHKKCAVCGAKAELHHVDQIGLGGDRTQAQHIGRRCLPLCRKHHDELHQMGGQSFLDYHHLKPGVIDERIAKVYRLKGDKRSA